MKCLFCGRGVSRFAFFQNTINGKVACDWCRGIYEDEKYEKEREEVIRKLKREL